MSLYDQNWWNLELKRTDLKIRAKEKPNSNVSYVVVVDDYSGDDGNKD